MVSKLLVLKNEKIRKHYDNFYLHNVYLKSCTTNFFFSKRAFWKYENFFFSLVFYSKITNFCFFSYRRRGVFNFFCLTRMMFKYYAVTKYLTGIKKASW
jgi:ribosomal protein S14